MPLWSFNANVERTRAIKLLSAPDFEYVLQLLGEATIACFRWKDFDNERLRGCHRAEYVLSVEADTYDVLFNAPVGLRAQYALGAAHGEAANRRIIELLRPRLPSFGTSGSAPPPFAIEWSLAGTQAKIWIDEKEAESQLGQAEAQINYQPWRVNSESGVGLLAPRATRLEVKGGWYSPHGTVVLDPWKIKRSEDIHREGYS
jgi:hypothetical protein